MNKVYSELISQYNDLYDSMVSEFYASEITTSGKPLVSWLKYYDLVLIAILLNKHKDIRKDIDVDILRMAAELFILGNRHTSVLQDRQAREFVDAILFNTEIPHTSVFQILLTLDRTIDTIMSIEAMYMLPIIALIDTKRFPNYIHRSNIMVVMIDQLKMVKKYKDHKFDVTTDAQRILLKLKRLLININADTTYDDSEYVDYVLDTYRMFIIAYFGSLIQRDCLYREFKTLGQDVVYQKYMEHKYVLDKKLMKPKQ